MVFTILLEKCMFCHHCLPHTPGNRFIPICNRPLSKPSIFSQILKFKSELKDVAEDKEVAELQLQEVAGRWKSILKEKDVCIFSII